MSGDAREGLVQRLRHHIQITLLGALLVLAPLVLLVHTVLRVRHCGNCCRGPSFR